MSIFSTEIISIGSGATEMIESGFFILFGETVPKELKEYCYIIKVQPITGDIVPGKKLVLGEQNMLITAVGNEVQANLENLGHVTVKFDGSTVAELPGTIYVEKNNGFHLMIGDTLQII